MNPTRPKKRFRVYQPPLEESIEGSSIKVSGGSAWIVVPQNKFSLSSAEDVQKLTSKDIERIIKQ